MGSAQTVRSTLLGRFLKTKREELGLTLRQASTRLAAEGTAIPVSSLGLIETGRQEPGAVRLHQLLRLYGVPAHLVGDLLELEHLAAEPPAERDLATLQRNGIAAWKSGSIGVGLAHLFAVRELAVSTEADQRQRQTALLNFSVAAAGIGRLRLAREIVGDLLCGPPHEAILVRVLVHAAMVWSRLGSVHAGMAFARQAESLLPRGNTPERAWVQHQLARLLLLSGKPTEARRYLTKAITVYRALGDRFGESNARTLSTTIIEASGNLPAALRAAGNAERFARKHGYAAIAATAAIQVGRILLALGRIDTAIRKLHSAHAEVSQIGDPHGQFLAHYYLWKAYERAGDATRARFEHQAARHFVQFVDEDSAEARDARNPASPMGDHHA